MQQSQPAFGASSSAFGGGLAASQPSPFGGGFGASAPSFGASTPAFGLQAPTFGAASTPAFGAASTPAFGAGGFGATGKPALAGCKACRCLDTASSPAFGTAAMLALRARIEGTGTACSDLQSGLSDLPWARVNGPALLLGAQLEG